MRNVDCKYKYPLNKVKKLISDVNLFVVFYFWRVRPDVSVHVLLRSDGAEVGIGSVGDHLFSWSVNEVNVILGLNGQCSSLSLTSEIIAEIPRGFNSFKPRLFCISHSLHSCSILRRNYHPNTNVSRFKSYGVNWIVEDDAIVIGLHVLAQKYVAIIWYNILRHCLIRYTILHSGTSPTSFKDLLYRNWLSIPWFCLVNSIDTRGKYNSNNRVSISSTNWKGQWIRKVNAIQGWIQFDTN